MNKSTAVLVVSCDKYSDLWPIFFGLWHKYWPNCQLKMYLGTNFFNYSDPALHVIKIGTDQAYSDNILKFLKSIDEDFVLLVTEDFFLSESVDDTSLSEHLHEFFSKRGKYLKLVNTYPLGFDNDTQAKIGLIEAGVKYRTGLGVGLWDKNFLLKNIPPGMSAWELEKNGILASRMPDDAVFGFNSKFRGKRPFQHFHGVIKGAWTRDTLPFLKKEGYEDYIGGRPILGLVSTLYVKLFGVLMYVFKKTGYKWKLKLPE